MAPPHSHHDHHHSHDHSHHGHHHHSHDNVVSGFRWAFFLNLGFAIFEFVGGFYVNSVAVMSDALHDLGDSLALGLAWILEKLSRRQHDARLSYGFRRWSTVSSLITSGIIICGSFIVITESIPRLFNPEQPKVQGMMILAVIGLLVNGVSFLKIKGHSLAEKSLRWHFIEDIMGWVAVLISAIVMSFVDFPILDPIMAIAIAIWIAWNVIHSTKETLSVFLQAVPGELSIEKIQSHFNAWPEIKELHHTHVWSMDGRAHILTTHLILRNDVLPVEVMDLISKIKKELKATFSIVESTIEVEWPNIPCADPTHE